MPLSTIGTNQIADSAVAVADIADGSVTTAKIADNAVTTAKVNPSQTDITSVGTLTSFRSTGIDDNADALAMTIDSSENILFGKTSSSLATDGIEAKANGSLFVTRSSAIPVSFRRSSDDGEIIKLYQDGTNIGSIGSRSGVALNIVLDPRDSGGNGGSGLTGVGDVIRPTNYTGSNTDNHVSLGSSSFRFKDIYLSSGVRVGGTGTSNLLDDYEEGTFTADLDSSGATITQSVSRGDYTKIGNTVWFNIYVQMDGTLSGNNNAVSILGLPFTSVNNSQRIYLNFCATRNINFDNGYSSVVGYIGNHESRVQLFQNGDNVILKELPSGNLSNSSGQVFVQGFYHVS